MEANVKALEITEKLSKKGSPYLSVKTDHGIFNILKSKGNMVVGGEYHVHYEELPLADGKVTRWCKDAVKLENGVKPTIPAQDTPIHTDVVAMANKIFHASAPSMDHNQALVDFWNDLVKLHACLHDKEGK